MSRIDFGMHRGKTWEDVYKSNPGYVDWAISIGKDVPMGLRKERPLKMVEYIYNGCNDEQKLIVDLLKDKKNVISPGIPGSGKSHVAKNLEGSIVALAPTGVAAMNIGGSTFHSYFNIDPNDLLLEVGPRAQRCPNNTLWVMDEVFYTSASVLYKVMSHILSKTTGAQFLLLGDPMQLKPVERRDATSRGETEYDKDEKIAIRELKEWKGKTVFDVFDHLGISYNLVKLVKSIRHSNPDTFEFMKAARCASLSKDQLMSIKVVKEPPLNAVTLTYTNDSVDKINRDGLAQFKKLIGIAVKKSCTNKDGEEITEEMITNSDTNQGHKTLLLKKLKYWSRKFNPEVTAVGARVMVTKNIKDGGNFIAVNGDTGIVTFIKDNEIGVQLDRTKQIIDIKRIFHGYTCREGNWKIGVTLIPVRTCYAVTIHKSQGMTIACPLHIIVDQQMATKPGLLYTGVTRSENIKNISVSEALTNKVFAYDKKWFKKFEAL